MNQYPLQYDPQQNTIIPAAQYWRPTLQDLIPIVVCMHSDFYRGPAGRFP